MRVMRFLTSLAMVVVGLLIAAPFLLSWRAIDEHGIEITGKVESKREYVRVRYSNWDRICEAMIFFTPPDDPVNSSVVAKIDPAHFDQLRNGRPATLRYLRIEDMPRVPGALMLRKAQLLPVAKLPGQYVYEPYAVRALGWIACGAVILVLWRVLRWPGFPWAAAAGIAILLAGILNSEFPRPTPEPHDGVRTATGRIAVISRVNYLFGGNRSRGMEAAQPIDIVGVEFTPAPGAESVLAIDLLDAGSIEGLKTGGSAVVNYEAAAPRTARIQGGTRQFAEKNLQGGIFAGAIGIGLFLGLFALLALIGRALKSAVQRPLRALAERNMRGQNRF